MSVELQKQQEETLTLSKGHVNDNNDTSGVKLTNHGWDEEEIDPLAPEETSGGFKAVGGDYEFAPPNRRSTFTETGDNSTFIITFNIETLRFVSYLALMSVMALGYILTALFVTVPNEETVIYKTFGFNHTCNVMDHHPAREVAALLIIFMIGPFCTYHILSFLRTRRAYKKGQVSKYFYRYSLFMTPFAFLFTAWTYMWFVNPPDDEYGFLAHYIPYGAFQTMIGLVEIHQVGYQIFLNKLPFGLTPFMAKTYVVVLIGMTIFYTLYVITILAPGQPILDSPNNPTHATIAQVIMYLYAAMAYVAPCIAAFVLRKNGDFTVVTIA